MSGGCWRDPMARLRRKGLERLRAECLRLAEILEFRPGYLNQCEWP